MRVSKKHWDAYTPSVCCLQTLSSSSEAPTERITVDSFFKRSFSVVIKIYKGFIFKSYGFYPLIQTLTNFLECNFFLSAYFFQWRWEKSFIITYLVFLLLFKVFTGFLYPVKPTVAG